MCVSMLLTVIATSCGTGTSTLGDNSKKAAELKKVTNVYGSENFPLPEGYHTYGNHVSYFEGKLHILCEKIIDEETYTTEPAILVMDLDGSNQEFTPYTLLNEEAYLNSVHFTPDSQIFLETMYNPDTMSSEKNLIKYDTAGNLVFSKHLAGMFPEDQDAIRYGYSNDVYIEGINVDAAGRIYVLANTGILVLSPDGETLFTIAARNSRIMINIGDKMAFTDYDDTSYEYVLRYIDTDEMKAGDSVAIPPIANLGYSDIYEKSAEDTSDFLFYMKTTLSFIGVSETGTTEIINWLNSDIDSNQIGGVKVIDSDTFYYSGYDQVTYDPIMYLLNRIPDEDIVPKYIIELAYIENGSYHTLPGLAAKFNQMSDKYRVTLFSYSVEQNSEITPVQILNNDIAAGKIPDMFLLDAYNFNTETSSVKDYEDKGLFVDLYEFMSTDSELNADKLLGCVKTPFESDGKLFRLAYDIAIETLIGKTSEVGDYKGWSLSEFLDAAESTEDGVALTSISTQIMFNYQINRFITEFIDYEAATCNFNDPVFIRLLNHIISLPAALDYDNYDYSAEQRRYKTGETLLQNTYFGGVSDVMNIKNSFGLESFADLTFVGYPTSNGADGSSIFEVASYAISAMSEPEIREGSWQFMKFIFDTENIRSSERGMRGIPATRAALETSIEAQLDTYYIMYENGWSSSQGEWSEWDLDRAEQENGVPMRFTREEGDIVTEYLNSITGMPAIPDKALEIIQEELTVFLGGGKTAEETANVIQSKISIYLSEKQ